MLTETKDQMLARHQLELEALERAESILTAFPSDTLYEVDGNAITVHGVPDGLPDPIPCRPGRSGGMVNYGLFSVGKMARPLDTEPESKQDSLCWIESTGDHTSLRWFTDQQMLIIIPVTMLSASRLPFETTFTRKLPWGPIGGWMTQTGYTYQPGVVMKELALVGVKAPSRASNDG